jgi:hypothetical protein
MLTDSRYGPSLSPARPASTAKGLGFRSGPFSISGMMRMRPKRPTGMPNINSGKPWSAMDIQGLEDFLWQDVPIGEIAHFRCRDMDQG